MQTEMNETDLRESQSQKKCGSQKAAGVLGVESPQRKGCLAGAFLLTRFLLH